MSGMKRWRAGNRALLAVVLAGSLLTPALAACGTNPQGTDKTEETPVDYGDVANAVTTALPRVVAVEDPGWSQNGFGYRFSLTLETDSADPFTSDELDAVVEAIWHALPKEPNTIELIAGTSDDVVVDLRAAAEELDPLVATNAGQGGVSLTGMWSRYGKWAAPE